LLFLHIFRRFFISVKEGENVSVQLSGRKGESKEFDIFIGGKYFATTGTITF